LPLAAFVLASIAICVGVFDPLWTGASLGESLLWNEAGWQKGLAPGAPDPWAGRLVLSYVFAQSVHYAIWLRLVPEDDRDRPSPRTFRASWKALHSDLGPLMLGLAFASALALAIWAMIDLSRAHANYFRFAQFHAVLELCVLASVLVEGRKFIREDR
jgi:hypothetical protein